ncbi:zinc finger CCCH domain-containing protein 48-like [Vigna unguiculata]|uniref:zinc finger CCCH domain-containing protein 48-like n=1 Tax=Vigna unguiculata TaxID=3917 RepID=UPI001016A13F|nr:zinc finger CCCH domain-containing protein 48-like [Vigna unguiculata]
MDTKSVKMNKEIYGKTCIYWRAGRCNRNPCKFMHAETPSTHTSYLGINAKSKICGKKHHSSYKIISKSKKTLVQKSEDRDGTNVVVSKKSSRTICKYWTNNRCLYGEQCINLHSWFQSDEFSTIAELHQHKKAITGITLLTGTNKLYSGSTDGTVRIWDCHTGQSLKVINFGTEVNSLISEGPWIFVGLKNAIKAFNTKTNLEYTLDGPKGRILHMAVGNDILFVGAEDGVITAWRESSETKSPFELAGSLIGHTESVVCLIVSLNVGWNMLYSGSMDQSIKVWNIDTLQCTMTLNEHTGVVTSLLCWEKYLFSSSSDGTIKIWAMTEVGTLAVVYTHNEQSGIISLFGMHDANGKPILFSSCTGNLVCMYELPSFSERGRLFAKKDITSFGLVADGGLFLTGDGTGLLRVWKWNELPKVASN